MKGNLPSAVNINTDGLLQQYRPDYSVLNDLLLEKGGTGIGSIDLAIYFSILSSAVYETNFWHARFFTNWGFPAEQQSRVLNYNSCSSTILSKEVNGKLLLIVVFKGASPLDLNGWMHCVATKRTETDSLALKHGIDVEGIVHTGFFRSLTEKADRTVEYSPLQFVLQECRERISAYKRVKRDFDPARDLNFWITGHSLGAAFASVFASIVVSASREEEKVKAADTVVIDLFKGLNGVYTFGSPKVGDRNMTHSVNTILKELNVPFRRFRNGNDIVSTIPPGTGLLEDIVTSFSTRTIIPKESLSTMTDYGELGEGYRLGYYGSCAVPMDIPPDSPLERKDPMSKRFRRAANAVELRYKRYSNDFKSSLLNSQQSFLVSMKTLMQFAQCSERMPDALERLVFQPNKHCVLSMILLPTALFDHLPVGYVRNLYLLKLIQQSKGEP